MVPPNLNSLIELLASEATKRRGRMERPYIGQNIFRIPVLGQRDPLIQSNGLIVELAFIFSESKDCDDFIKFADQEFQKAPTVNGAAEPRGSKDPTGKAFRISYLWVDN